MHFKSLLILLAPGLISACAAFAPTHNPIPTDPAQEVGQSDTLVIMMPGRGEGGESFRARGFFDQGRDQGFDMLAVDAHMGYYRERILIERLHRDVVLPARERGYKNIWLLGISLGGFGSALYTREHPEQIDGLILLAPYPGETALVDEILAAGGLGNWPGGGSAGKDYERELWRWFKAVTEQPGRPEMLLGYGTEDRFADVGEILGPRLPQQHLFTAPGGHRWPVWKQLWQDILARGFLSN